MFGSQCRFTIEVANPETGTYEAQFVANETYEVVNNMAKAKVDEFRVVMFKQDVTGIYRRDSFVELELKGLDGYDRASKLFEQMDILIK